MSRRSAVAAFVALVILYGSGSVMPDLLPWLRCVIKPAACEDRR